MKSLFLILIIFLKIKNVISYFRYQKFFTKISYEIKNFNTQNNKLKTFRHYDINDHENFDKFDTQKILKINDSNNNQNIIIKSDEEKNNKEINNYFEDDDIKTIDLFKNNIFTQDFFDKNDDEQFEKFLKKIKDNKINEDELINFLCDENIDENSNEINVLENIFTQNNFEEIFYHKINNKYFKRENIDNKIYSIVGDITSFTKMFTNSLKNKGIDFIFINKELFSEEELIDIDYDFRNDFSIYYNDEKFTINDIFDDIFNDD